MKNGKIISSVVLVILLSLYGFTARTKACDVATYVAILKAESAKLKAIPEQKSSRDIVVGYTEGTKYLVMDLAKLFERRVKGSSVFTEELKNLKESSSFAESFSSSLENNKSDIVIVPTLINHDNNLLHSISNWAITFARDELILVFGGEGKHKDAIEKQSWNEIINNKEYLLAVATDEKKCLSHYTKVLFSKVNINWTIVNSMDSMISQTSTSNQTDTHLETKEKDTRKIMAVGTGVEVIEKIVKGEADYGFIYKSMARTFAMLTKNLPANINQSDLISYAFAIKQDSPNNTSAALFADTILSTGGFFKIQASGFKSIAGGKIDFKAR
jgi:ABC-type molybdate transport system substrate-binding protein